MTGTPIALRRLRPGARMSQAVVHGDTVYLAGQVALGAGDAGVGAQTRTILDQIDALLAEAGTDKRHILSATIWLTDIATFGEMNDAWDAWLPADVAPARATIGAALALPEFKVEIAVIAAVR